MPSAARRKDHPLSLRLPDADLALIDRAAGLRGRSRTEFMRDAAIREAEATVMDNALIRMSGDGFAAFMAALDLPGEVVPELVEIGHRRAPWEADR